MAKSVDEARLNAADRHGKIAGMAIECRLPRTEQHGLSRISS
jgi:hypothetical protein